MISEKKRTTPRSCRVLKSSCPFYGKGGRYLTRFCCLPFYNLTSAPSVSSPQKLLGKVKSVYCIKAARTLQDIVQMLSKNSKLSNAKICFLSREKIALVFQNYGIKMLDDKFLQSR